MNGKINYGLLVRFLRGQVGKDWNEVYSEIINRIPTRLMEHKEMIHWFVADKVSLVDGRLWNKRSQKFIYIDGSYDFSQERKEFYVDPVTNVLVKIQEVKIK